jgi:sugar lactone lactonase YvrE
MKFEIAVDAHAFIGEGPVWDGDRGVLWWIDIFRHEIHAYDPATGDDRAVDVGAQIGAVARRASGGLVAAMPEGLVAVDPDTGKQEILAIVDHDSTTMRLNDGKCDSRGRFWAGSIAHNPTNPEAVGPQPGGAKLYRFDPDGTVTAMLDGVTVSNGMGWSPEDDTFYFIDTMTHAVDAFDFDADTGAISNRRTLASVPPTEGIPDGMCVDEDGCVWLAASGAGQLRRITPSGELDQTVDVPISRVTSCAFGGVGLKDLYVTSHSAMMSRVEMETEPNSGALLRGTPGVRGLPSASFAG